MDFIAAYVMSILKPLMLFGKRFMDPTGGEIIDKICTTIPMFTNALGNNNMTTVHRTINENLKLLKLLPSHITQPQFRAFASEYIDGYSKIVACLNQGKCGFQVYYLHMFNCVSPLTAIFKSLLQ